ncbi:MAG: hypothetical protein F6K41_22380 [Symploca sp. SIO3E6]|nr:hypothetical protein [Caldora sp. SIO3E6]
MIQKLRCQGSGGAEERRSGGAEERRSGGAEKQKKKNTIFLNPWVFPYIGSFLAPKHHISEILHLMLKTGF